MYMDSGGRDFFANHFSSSTHSHNLSVISRIYDFYSSDHTICVQGRIQEGDWGGGSGANSPQYFHEETNT